MRLEESTLDSAQNSPKKSRFGWWIGLSIVVLLLLGFLWRVVFYYVQIQKGAVIPPQSYLSSLTLDRTLENAATPAIDTTALQSILDSQDDPSLGPPADKALLTIVEFADFGCPYSRDASYMARLLAEYSGFVRYVYRDFPILDVHPDAARAAEAGHCANDQGRFFDYHDKLYQNQYDLRAESLVRYAVELGLDGETFERCLTSKKYTAKVESERILGESVGVRGTPTFFFNGVRIEGAIPRDVLLKILAKFVPLQR
ncbi:DsbA family protein [Candidatus Uhrbacteria bacterium]|nr:DsbA family protein [Candidatus Uhrbacteria bacterium]